MLEPRRICQYCSGRIAMRRARVSVYCSRDCCAAIRKGYRPVSVRGKFHGFCAGCKSKFDRRTPKQIFCTNECRALHIKAMRPDKQCVVCGSAFPASANSNVCSTTCRQQWRDARLLEAKLKSFGPPRTCKQCAKVFTHGGTALKGYCSAECRIEFRKEAKKRDAHVRRARKAKATIEHFNPTYILKRDKYICQACGVKTRPDKKPNHPLYPNVDHIVPLSVGGEHSKKNCRCVCTSCNSKKCNRTLNDQLLLFG